MAEKVFTAVPPFRMAGEVYFVGTKQESCHIIKTSEGLILIDTGSVKNLPFVEEGARKMGLDLNELKIILLSHWHGDHSQGADEMRKKTGARILIGKYDAHGLAFEPDGVLEDGEKVTLGETEILCLHTPGHTDGTMSFFFNVEEGGKTYRAGMFGGAGTNQIRNKFLRDRDLSLFQRADFFASLERLKKEEVTLFLGNHTWNNQTVEKGEILLQTGENQFLGEGMWEAFLEKCRKSMWKVIESEIASDFVTYGHRGNSAVFPENTMSSFRSAVECGANGLETDVRRTKDGVLVLCHDKTLSRLQGREDAVADLTLEELRAVPVKNGEKEDVVPTLEEFLSEFADTELILALELKAPDIEKDVLDAVRRHGLERRVEITSFKLEYLENVRRLDPVFRTGFLAKKDAITPALLSRMREAGIDQICPPAAAITSREDTVRTHALGFRVRCWGVSSAEEMRRLVLAGVDGMTFNWPDQLVAYQKAIYPPVPEE